MKVLMLVALVVVVSAGPLDNCQWQREEWCSSLRIAKQCGAVEYCISREWSHPQSNQDAGEICQYCENIIGDVRNFLANNQTEAQVEKFLDQACSVIPVSELADQCKEYVDNDLPELFQIIRADLDPQTVCTAIGLCSKHPRAWKAESTADNFFAASLVQGVPNTPKASVKAGGDICKDCKTLVNDVKQLLTQTTTQKELEAMLKESVCQSMGSMAAECDSLVDMYAPELLTLISQEIDPDMICSILCTQNKKGRVLLAQMRLEKSPLYKAAQKVASIEGCLLCKTVLSELQNLDRDHNVQAEVENFFKQKVCTELGSLKETCQQTVAEYAPYLFELLVNELDPETRCRSLGLCSQSNSVESIVRHASPSNKKVTQSVTATTECILCEFIMKQVDDLLAKNTSEEAIIAALDKVCSVLPDTIKQDCETFVDTYGPAIIELLAQELDPQQVCTALGLCKASSNAATPVHKSLLQFPLKISSGELCGVCETIIQYIDSLLEENSTMQEIESLLDKVCNFLPKDLQSQCDDFVAQYGPAVVQLIAQFADPKEICTDLHLCNAAKSKAVVENMIERAPSPPLLGAEECTWGPSYWCASKENAQKCKAVSHCEKHVWKN